MRKLFPRQYWLSWLGAAVFFMAVFPYGLLHNTEEPWVYGAFCILLGALSAAFYRAIVFKAWVRRFYIDQYRYYVWPLVILSFCHLVFTRIHWGGCVCIGAAAVILLCMLLGWIKDWLRQRKEEE